MEKFEIPIVLFIFKRQHSLKKIMDRISKIEPQKFYIIADGPRNKEEKIAVENCRKIVEKSINWSCEVIKNYAESNRGVYKNIAEGAKWVFEKEEFAIFLEDDNLPEETFFEYCKELLYRYKENQEILWICGTNYLQEYKTKDNSSYVFTRHLLPCGWASWAEKFNKFYDGKLNILNIRGIEKKIRRKYRDKRLFRQQMALAKMEKRRIDRNLEPISWDYQMSISIRANDLYGISPKYNQIENIGVDNDSIHGGNSYENIMTKRFCTIKTKKLEFPLIHPKEVKVDKKYEKKVGKIILYPFSYRLKIKISRMLKRVLKLEAEDSVKEFFKQYIRRKKRKIWQKL